MKVSRFAQGLVKSGTKTGKSNNPELEVKTTYNNFELNEPAQRLMGVSAGDTVQLFDASYMSTPDDVTEGYAESVGIPIGCEDKNDRFFITPGFYIDGKEAGAKLGAKGTFSYSGVYGAMHFDQLGERLINKRTLSDNGLLVVKKGATAIATHKIFCKIAPVYLTDEGESTLEDTGNLFIMPQVDGFDTTNKKGKAIEVPVFAITDLKFEDYTPRGTEEEVEEKEVIEEVENVEEV